MGTLGLLVFLGFVGFAIYLMFKSIQFITQAINLYKEMIARQDVMVKLLKDIRDRAGTDGEPKTETLYAGKFGMSGSETEKEIESKLPNEWKAGSSKRKNIEDDIRSGSLSNEGLMLKYEIDQKALNLICHTMLSRLLITDEQFARFVREVDEFAV